MAKKKKSNFRFDLCFFVVLVIILLIGAFYLRALTTDIYGGDVGDLVTAAFVGGVAHPPGYPLFTFVGFLLTHIPLSVPAVSKVAFISLGSSLLSLFLIWKITRLYIDDKLIQIATVLSIAFTYHFWLFAEIPEVFALNVLLILCVLYNAVKFYKEENKINLWMSFLFFGLALTNHHTSLFVIPLLVGIVIAKRKKIKPKSYVMLSAFFVIGLVPYIYVPIAASHNPILNWDNASTLQNFINLILRRDYGTFTAGSFQRPVYELRVLLLKNYLGSIVASLTLPVIVISLTGVLYVLKKQAYITLLLAVVIIISGPFFIVYAGFPISNTFILATVERFYLLSEVLLFLFFPWGLLAIKTFFLTVFSKKIYATILLCAFFLIPILLLNKNMDKTNLSKVTLGTEFGKSFLKNLPQNAVLLVEGDTKSFNVWYVHFVLKYRPDVEVIQMGNFAIRNDFFDSFYKKGKKVMSVEDDLNDFFKTVIDISSKRPVYTTTIIKLPNTNYKWIPVGTVAILTRKDNQPSRQEYGDLVAYHFKNIEIPERGKLTIAERNLTLSDIPTYYADSLVKIGDTLHNDYGDYQAAIKYYKYATVVDPTYSKGYIGKANIETKTGQCKESDVDARHAISLFPIDKTYYFFWYINASDCFADQNRIKTIASEYKKTFNQNILDDLKKEIKQ